MAEPQAKLTLDKDVLYQGWLIKAPPLKHVKQATTKRWRKRWFVLRASMCRLSYYTDETMLETKGEIDLKFSKRVLIKLEAGSKKNVWSIEFEDRDYYFQALSEADMIKWAHHIQEVFMKRNNSSSGSGSGSNKNIGAAGRARTNTMPKPHRGESAPRPPPPPSEGEAKAAPTIDESPHSVPQRDEALVSQPTVAEPVPSVPPTDYVEPAPAVHMRKPEQPKTQGGAPVWIHTGLTEEFVPARMNSTVPGTWLVWKRLGTYTLALVLEDGSIQNYAIENPDGLCTVDGKFFTGQGPGLVGLMDALVLPQQGWSQICVDFVPRPDAPETYIKAERRRSTLIKVQTISKNLYDAGALRQIEDEQESEVEEDDTFLDDEVEATADTGPALPPDWEAVMEVNTGELYYHNKITGVTSWVHPGEINNENEGDTKDAWEEIVDPETGAKYFHNSKTGQSSWDDPRVPKEEKKGLALYDYTAAKGEELDIKEGDHLTATIGDDGSGWLFVTKQDGTSGYVPATYVEFGKS